MTPLRLKIVNTGFYAPPKIVSAVDLADRIQRTPDWIISRTGVGSRRVAEEPMEDMAAHAARQALDGSGPPDLLINASVTQRQFIPDSSVFILRALGLDGIPSFSVRATCLSFMVALHNAAALLEAGAYRRILVVSSESGSLSLNYNQPESAALIGDGAAAAVVERTPERESSALLAWEMMTWPKGAELAELRGCGTLRHPNSPKTKPEDNLFDMDGPAIYRFTKKRAHILVKQLLKRLDLTPADIDLVVPHQASGPALDVYPKGGFREDRIVNIVGDYGNCIAASLPMALAWAQSKSKLRRGDTVMMIGTGAGVSAAAAVFRF